MERRNFTRHKIDCNLPVLNSDTGFLIGVVKNISKDGIQIYGNGHHPVTNEELNLWILGDKKYGGKVICDFKISVIVVWHKKIGHNFTIGCQILGLPEEYKNQIESIIEQLN